jgi:hypothetical protein
MLATDQNSLLFESTIRAKKKVAIDRRRCPRTA